MGTIRFRLLAALALQLLPKVNQAESSLPLFSALLVSFSAGSQTQSTGSDPLRGDVSPVLVQRSPLLMNWTRRSRCLY
ncbi:hypothetical protein MHYP_G00169240 [Metynnis hypsauchen]